MGGNKIMNKKILVILLITMVFLIGIPQVQANRNIFNNFTKLYDVPNSSDAKLNKCETCMIIKTPPGSWNKYGLALRSNASFNRSNPIQAMRNIEPLDSDGDKFTNIDEIHNSTLPGDASDFPSISTISVTASATNTPAQTQTPTQTPAITPTSTPAGTEPKPAYTIMNGFSTVIVFAILYVFATRKRRD
jgi:hypothetical protein